MSESKFKTLRHIETVRNFINSVIGELMNRAEIHDQTKLKSPEVEIFEKYTPLLRGTTYGSEQYKKYMKEMKVAIDHHNLHNRHHPEFHKVFECNGCFKHFNETPDKCNICGYSQFTERHLISKMNLIDLVEMLCDWKAAGLRHADGDIFKSIEINQERFGYSDELKQIFINTAQFLNDSETYHHAEES